MQHVYSDVQKYLHKSQYSVMATAVTVLCANGRRVGVKVSPSTVLLKVESIWRYVSIHKTYHVHINTFTLLMS